MFKCRVKEPREDLPMHVSSLCCLCNHQVNVEVFYLQQMFRWNWFSRFCFFELIYGTNNSFKVHKPASDEMVQIIKFTYTHRKAQCNTHNVQVPNDVFS